MNATAELTRGDSWIGFPATIYPERFNTRSDRAQGHHLLVWSGGGNAHKALLETGVPDADILQALVDLGAQTGDNLTSDAWNQRMNPEAPEPDQRVEGSAVQITVRIGEREISLHELFVDESTESFDVRVGGHAALIPVWRSGCVTCLFSCPGGRTSNAAYTIRDQAMERKSFIADVDALPDDGTEVWVQLTLDN